MSERDALLQRLDAVERELAALAVEPYSADARTQPDPRSGERWDAGQVWAHLAEFVPYWVDQSRAVVAGYEEEAVPFGRTSTDADRVGAIERDRGLPIPVLWSQTLSDIEAARQYIESLDEQALAARGAHPTLGVMSVAALLDEFIVGHLEQHATQLNDLA